jgi:hypothetical protein
VRGIAIAESTGEPVILWRYVSIEKFIDFLRGKSLYLRRVDLLEDAFEGTLSKSTLQFLEDSAIKFMKQVNSDKKFGGAALAKVVSDDVRRLSYVNCWNESQFESPALWKIYVPEGRGVAIRTTRDSLRSAIDDTLTLAPVKYVDFLSDVFASSLDDSLLFYKRVQFSYENEWRVLKQLSPFSTLPAEAPEGIEISATSLEFDVILPPSCPDLTAKSVFAVMSSFNCAASWYRSSLDDVPAY